MKITKKQELEIYKEKKCGKFHWHCFKCGMGLVNSCLINKPEDSLCLFCAIKLGVRSFR